MGRTSNTDVVRIELSTPGEWVDVKRRMGVDDERRRNALMLRGQPLKPGGQLTELDAGALVAEAPFATLVVVARAWNVTDPETGKRAALTEENLRALSDEDLAIVQAKFEELYAPALTEEQGKN